MSEMPIPGTGESEVTDQESPTDVNRIIDVLRSNEVDLIAADELEGKNSHDQQQIVLWTLKEMGFTAPEAEIIGQECFPGTWEGSAW